MKRRELSVIFAFRVSRWKKTCRAQASFPRSKATPGRNSVQICAQKGQGINWNIESSETYRIYTWEMVAFIYVVGFDRFSRKQVERLYLPFASRGERKHVERKRVFQGAKRPPDAKASNFIVVRTPSDVYPISTRLFHLRRQSCTNCQFDSRRFKGMSIVISDSDASKIHPRVKRASRAIYNVA